jgi:hypothetical protein
LFDFKRIQNRYDIRQFGGEIVIFWIGIVLGLAAPAGIDGDHTPLGLGIGERWRKGGEVFGRPCEPWQAHDRKSGRDSLTIFSDVQTQPIGRREKNALVVVFSDSWGKVAH